MIIQGVWGDVGMFYHITLFNTGVAFSRQFSSLLNSVAMETKGTILILLRIWTFYSKKNSQIWLNIKHFQINLL